MTPSFTPLTGKPLHGLSLDERTELRMGRAHWTIADYLNEGRREFDALYIDTGKASPWQPGNREEYARKYVQMFCPAGKRIQERAA